MLHEFIRYNKGFGDCANMASAFVLFDYHQLFVKSSSPIEREKSSKQR